MSAVPAAVPAALKSPAAVEARKLYAAALEAREAVEVAHATNAESDRQLHEAVEAYEAVLMDAKGNFDPSEEKLSQSVASARVRASDEVKARRVQAATLAAADAAYEYVTFTNERAADLLGEYRQIAEKATSALATAQEQADKLMHKPLKDAVAARETLEGLFPLVATASHPEQLDWDLGPDQLVPQAAIDLIDRATDPEAWDGARAAQKAQEEQEHQEVVRAAEEREHGYLAAKAGCADLAGRAAAGKLQGEEARLWMNGQHPAQIQFAELRPGTHAALAEEHGQLYPFAHGGQISPSGRARHDELLRLMAEHPARHVREQAQVEVLG